MGPRARHRPRGRPVRGAHLGRGHGHHPGRRDLRHRSTPNGLGRRSPAGRAPAAGPHRRGGLGHPHWGSLHPLRLFRAHPGLELRPVDPPGSPRPDPRRHDLRHDEPVRVGAVPLRRRCRLRRHRHREPGTVGRTDPGAPCGAAVGDRALVPGRVRHQGCDLPAVFLVARQLPHCSHDHHRGLRRAADQDRRLCADPVPHPHRHGRPRPR